MPHARATDPQTSHDAGKAADNPRLQQIVFKLVAEHPFKTARELELLADGVVTPVDTVHKRVSDLAYKGRIKSPYKRQCTVTGRMAHCWQIASLS